MERACEREANHNVSVRTNGHTCDEWKCNMVFQYKSAGSYETSERAIIRTFKTTVEPTIEPITLAMLKDRLRIGSTLVFDVELALILTQARKQVEADTYRRLITQTVVGYMDEFRWVREIEIRLAPVSAIASITYTDLSSVSQTFASSRYSTDFISTPPRIVLKTNQQVEYTEENTPNAVVITMTAGYGSTAASVPAVAKLAIVEYAKILWGGCDGSEKNYQRLISSLQWTAFHKVM